jgi:hypothetical protein
MAFQSTAGFQTDRLAWTVHMAGANGRDELVVGVAADVLRLAKWTPVVGDVPLVPDRAAKLNPGGPDVDVEAP